MADFSFKSPNKSPILQKGNIPHKGDIQASQAFLTVCGSVQIKPQSHKTPRFQPKVINSVAARRLVAAERLSLRGRRHPAHLLKASKEISYACQGISAKTMSFFKFLLFYVKSEFTPLWCVT